MARIKPKKLSSYPWYLRVLFYLQKKKYGVILEPLFLWGRIPRIFLAFLRLNKRLNRKKSPLDPLLRALTTVKVSQINHCAFCIDMNSMLFFQRGGEEDKMKALPNFATSDLFSEKEKVTLEYAEKITRAPAEVSDELFDRLKKEFDNDAIVELTALIGFQNLSSKFNSALQAKAAGFCTKGKEDA